MTKKKLSFSQVKEQCKAKGYEVTTFGDEVHIVTNRTSASFPTKKQFMLWAKYYD